MVSTDDAVDWGEGVRQNNVMYIHKCIQMRTAALVEGQQGK